MTLFIRSQKILCTLDIGLFTVRFCREITLTSREIKSSTESIERKRQYFVYAIVR